MGGPWLPLDPPPPPPLSDDEEKTLPRKFASVRRGYHRKEVDDFLDAVASQLLTLKDELGEAELGAHGTQNDSLETHAGVAAPQTASDQPDDRLGRLLAVVEHEAASMLEAAKAEAASITRDATGEAERIRKGGQAEARRSMEEARALLERATQEAGGMLSDLTRRRQQMFEGLMQMEQRVLSIASDLERVLDLGKPGPS